MRNPLQYRQHGLGEPSPGSSRAALALTWARQSAGTEPVTTTSEKLAASSTQRATYRVVDQLPALQHRVIPVFPHEATEVVHNKQVDRPKVGAEGLVEILAVGAEVEVVWLLLDLSLCHLCRRMHRE